MPQHVLKRFSLDGRVAVVTGALGRLGPVWIRALLQAGARVAAMDLPGADESAPFAELRREFGDALVLLRADVRDRASLEAALADCTESFGTPHILVNNAGIDQPPSATGVGHALADIPADVARQILEVNTIGLFTACQVFGQAMADAGRGSIVNIGSQYATVAPNGALYDHIDTDPPFLKPPFYGASKAAVVNLSRYLATLWAPAGVRVNTLSPGGVLGGQDEEFKRKFHERTPMGRMAADDDIAGPLVFLASDAASYVTGQDLLVDGGYTCW